MTSTMVHEASTLLLPLRESAHDARAFVARRLGWWGYGKPEIDLIVLLVSEIVTNAVLHAGTPASLSLSTDDDHVVRVAVSDSSPAPVQLQPHRHLSTSGRGLQILDSLADHWGVDSGDRYKTVWFEVATVGWL